MSDEEEQRRRLELFFRDIAEVLDRHGEIASRFVLAEMGTLSESQAPPEAETRSLNEIPAEGEEPFARAAEAMLVLRAQAARQRICVRFGIDPRTGQQVCLQWIEVGG